MQIRKAVITAAGRGVRLYPAADTVQKGMIPLVDRDGLPKPIIQIIAEEALDSGIEEVCVVCAPGDEAQYRRQFAALRTDLLEAYKGHEWARAQAERLDHLVSRLRFAVQEEPKGYGHAVYVAREFVGGEPFLLLLNDHLYLSDLADQRCAAQVIRAATQADCAIAAVHATREHLIGHYGTVSGKRVADAPGLYQIERILEKPSVSVAELELQTPGLRMGHYLCFFGMHVLTPTLFDILETQLGAAADGEAQLTPALHELAQQERYLALDVKGSRYDIGAKFGMVQAQIALSLTGRDHDSLLTLMVDALAEAQSRRGIGNH